ncbi:MAG: nitrite reductase small subunit NirD [Methylococcales bacterium]|jgi:nitrite reductase (NADH) small subunit|nr:nitrite reductase small subunit NirD [Methylococcales bacterium]
MTQWIDICSVDDLQPNSGVCALVNNQQVAIFYFPNEDKIYAIGNYDPIGKANVLSRGMVGDINGEPVVASPLFKQHFSLQSGRCLEQDEQVPCYSVRVHDDRIELAEKN